MKKILPLVVLVVLCYWMFHDTNGFVDTMQRAGGFSVDVIGQFLGKLTDVLQQL